VSKWAEKNRIAFTTYADLVSKPEVIALLRNHPRLMRGIDYSFAGLFGAFALKILTASAR